MMNRILSALLLLSVFLYMNACKKPDVLTTAASMTSIVREESTFFAGNLPQGSLQVFTIAGDGTSTIMNTPAGVAIDDSNNVYIADASNNRILKYSYQGLLTTLAGSGAAGFSPGTGTAATFNHPTGVAVNHAGVVYVADSLNHAIRAITSDGNVSTLAGTGQAGYTEGPANTAQFKGPAGVAVDKTGNVYVADAGNERIRKITTDGLVMLVAGDGNAGYSDLPGRFAEFDSPAGIAVDDSNNVYVADYNNNVIRKISPSTAVTTLAGGSGQFVNPAGVAVDAAKNVYVADRNSNLVKKISGNTVTTIAGSGSATFQDGVPAVAAFKFPTGVAVDPSGNLYIADNGNNRLRKMGITLMVSTLAGSTPGFANGTGAAAQFNGPNQITIDAAGNVYVADFKNNRIRKVTPGGVVTTLAGDGTAGFADGPGATAKFNQPAGIAVDAAGNVYVGELNNNRIRKITPAGVVSTYAGSGTAGYVDGPTGSARFFWPQALTVDDSGNVYVAENYNDGVRKITPAGMVSTLAGRGGPGYVDGTGTAAAFNDPSGITVDAAGNIYVADTYNQRIRKVTREGLVTTLAGSTTGFWGGYVEGPGNTAQFSYPTGVAVDASGNVYVADNNNARIRKITQTGNGSMVSTLAGTGPVFLLGAGYLDGVAGMAKFSSPTDVKINSSGVMYVCDAANNRIRKIQ